ncbi:thioesterase family protein [Azotobacter beijerinckii]|uniref:Acyl-CoA thioesterase FadM n=1 Tax=Azotobacter beijerinckii TaxID=170623 RepID=A0A1I3Y9X5_9GAMM|nr:thioesterase family protein [Azotobacter beijerinckii]SFA79534.1 Acyl-CoA thioesterase FadM [Azotobacter beijerinckii]SFK28664.1 Acyl-CoA thioesterase FadM [Azotobacter beijerinckii]
MARLHLEFPAHCLCYRTEMNVRNSDINGARHLGNDALVSMLSEARSRFLYAHGIDDSGAETSGPGIIVTDLATLYKAEAHARDRLRFEVGLADFNKYGGDIVFRVSRPADGALIALAKYGFVFFDYEAGKVVPIPAAFAARFPEVNRLP